MEEPPNRTGKRVMRTGVAGVEMLSLIVTFYDETAFLRTALRSVRNQGIADLDLILVNDNPESFSPDDMAALTSGFDLRLVQHTRNSGLSAARNSGIAAARGDWVGFLDADDYFTVGGLARHYAYARETGADITHAACLLGQVSSVRAKILERDAKMHMQKRLRTGPMAAEEAQFIVSSWSSIYRAAFLAEKGIAFDPEQRKFEDRLFVLNAVTTAETIAFLGAPARVWRKRANSISSAPTTRETHLLQVQLLEKCLDWMRAETERLDLGARFLKRELFNSVSRLIWDMDIIERLADDDPDYADMGRRIQALLGEESFGQQIYNDPMIQATSRVGMQTRKGFFGREDFFTIHKALREGDFKAAHALMEERKPQPTRRGWVPVQREKRLIIHVGLHKTGSTFIQHHLRAHAPAMLERGILVPETGFDQQTMGRPGALSGHQGLIRAMRTEDNETWAAFHREVTETPAGTILISAENFGFPTIPERDDLIDRLFQRLGRFAQTDVIALLRPVDAYAETFYSEWVVSGHPGGSRSIAEFLVDQACNLTDLPGFFAPFEAQTGRNVRLADFRGVDGTRDPWQVFCELAGFDAGAFPTLDVPRYATPDRESVVLLQLMNTMMLEPGKRRRLMDTYFAGLTDEGDRARLLSPEQRLDLLQLYKSASAEFARSRGSLTDLDAIEAEIRATDGWSPVSALPVSRLQTLLDTTTQIAAEPPANPRKPRKTAPPPKPRPLLRRLAGGVVRTLWR